ncbi:isoprenylcysteine carboxylmethyltransferase family protein [Novipirellula caenicola]|uniref:Isoprenylcysteine carboxyl methyltransferase (ICMT) family protein n=1 Tax=Novipirellula caenicola TaxID=1536901 RepID=A0ABP9VRE5_9BACT
MNAKQIVTSYLIVQAVATAAWWSMLWFVPSSVSWFHPASWPRETLLGFWLADFLLLIAGSSMTAIAITSEKAWASTAVWSLAAALWYPTFYCIGVSIITDQAWIAASLMVCMAGMTLAMATIYGTPHQTPATIRETPLNRTSAIVWTFTQTAIFWSVFLWILPEGIVEFQTRLHWPLFLHPGQTSGSITLFTAASLLGLWSGWAMAVRGDGTPLPTATAPKLVDAGPYRFVRNPMALAGIVQGIAVGWYHGSFVVFIYAIAGGFVWHCFVRPVEEADLDQRFGERYRQYKQRVRLWIPR